MFRWRNFCYLFYSFKANIRSLYKKLILFGLKISFNSCVSNTGCGGNCRYMLLFSAIFVLNKVTIYEGIPQKKFPAVPIWLFHVNRIETQDDNVCLPFCWSWSRAWKRGTNRIKQHWFWWLRHLLHHSKCTFMSWLLDSLDLLSRRTDTHRLISRVVYQWSVVSFVIKKLYVYYLWWNSVYI